MRGQRSERKKRMKSREVKAEACKDADIEVARDLVGREGMSRKRENKRGKGWVSAGCLTGLHAALRARSKQPPPLPFIKHKVLETRIMSQ